MSGPRGNDAARETTTAASTAQPWYRGQSQRRDAGGQPGSGIASNMFGWLAGVLMAGSVIVMAVDMLT
ncbi:hypothetical protein [Burkholderia sp. LA-2-3-30-S1-D2]|uniref:hypothetical protein n=1 Tax=Burkholderia sp. LA-2-3-30-S1-D2 TaxID=1637862 RepID=UPI00075CAC87|nr:hypothetical protein [Burkholderia sp. LA-2-3-30-S1-D2]AOI99958.1 hypothetical protein WS66_30115 [Burkholderia sp. LA-2-3-30-S1-D2]KVE12945.1 hypothetical protein WS66_15565 [Burkholderia sp. LA-2-3-30-S1-D2]